MSNGDPANFSRLKTEVQQRVAEQLGIRKELKDWSLNDIRDFQSDLENECKSTISEKWIYTHFKNETEKLPRIDVLHLLSQYCGYKNWEDFTFSQQEEPEQPTKKNWFVIALMPLLLLISVVGWIMRDPKPTVVFVDAYTKSAIPPDALTITMPSKTGKKVSVIKLLKMKDTLLVDGVYYKPKKIFLDDTAEGDTIKIELFPDDYALMLNYFSRSSSENWQRRENQLKDAIHEDAKIFQSHPQLEGLELLNRDEFIERLLLPVNSLKNLEIQDIVYKDDKIYRLRFVQNLKDE